MKQLLIVGGIVTITGLNNALSAGTHEEQPKSEFKIEEPDFYTFSKGSGIPVSEKYGKEALQLLLELTPPEYWHHPEFGLLPFNTQCDSCLELIHLRDANHRYYVSISHPYSRYFLQTSNGPLHYKDKNGFWRSINWYLTQEDGRYISRQPEMMVEVKPTSNGKFLTIKSDNYSISMTKQSILIIKGSEERMFKSTLNSSYSIGSGGLKFNNFFEQFRIDKRIKISRLRVAFEYVFNLPLEEWNINLNDDDTLIIVDTIYISYLNIIGVSGNIPVEGFSLIPYDSGLASKIEFLKMWLLNSNKHPFFSPSYKVEYDSTMLVIKVPVPVKELKRPREEFPIILDPIISISANNATTCGFGHDGNGGGSIYCACQVTITGLGGTQLVNAIYNIQWESNCGTNCLTATFLATYYHLFAQYHGWVKVYSYACNVEDPPGTSYWTCQAECAGCSASCTIGCGNHTCGTCSGAPISLPSFVTCLAPQCNDYTLVFESRNYHMEACNYATFFFGGDAHYCVCQIPCDNTTGACQTYELFMAPGWFSVTVEGRTVEATATANTDPDILTITCGQTVDLCANPQFGVSPYTVNWYLDNGTITFIGTGSGTNGCLLNYSPPSGLNKFFAVVTDACGNTFSDTVYINNTCILSNNDIILTLTNKDDGDLFLKWFYKGSAPIKLYQVLNGTTLSEMKIYTSITNENINSNSKPNYLYLGKSDTVDEGFWQIKGFTQENTTILSNIIFVSSQLKHEYAKVYNIRNTIVIDILDKTKNPAISIHSIDGKLLFKTDMNNKEKHRLEFVVPSPGKYIVNVGGFIIPISIVEF